MTRKVAAGAILLLLLHAAYAQWQRGVSSDSLSAANDSISILIPIVDSLEVLDSIHEAEYNRRDEAYRDSVAVWDARVASASSVVVVEDVRYDSIEAEMRQRADERMSTLLDDLTLAHDRALGAAGEALTVETRAKEASVSQAMMWRSLAEERRLGWDGEKALRIQETLRADAALRLASPPWSLKIVKDVPVVALGIGIGWLLRGR